MRYPATSFLSLVLLAVLTSAVAAAPSPESIQQAAREPGRLLVLLAPLEGPELNQAAAAVVREAAQLPLSGFEMQVRMVQVFAAIVRATGEQAPGAVAAAVLEVPKDLLAISVAAALVAADDSSSALEAAVLDAFEAESLEITRAAVARPVSTLGPLLLRVARDAAVGHFTPAELVRAGRMDAEAPVAKADAEPAPLSAETVTTTTTVAPPPPVLPSYPGQRR
jgi:hypothetical protein